MTERERFEAWEKANLWMGTPWEAWQSAWQAALQSRLEPESNMPPLPDISKLSKPLQLAFEEYARAYAEQQTTKYRKAAADCSERAEIAEQQTAELRAEIEVLKSLIVAQA